MKNRFARLALLIAGVTLLMGACPQGRYTGTGSYGGLPMTNLPTFLTNAFTGMSGAQSGNGLGGSSAFTGSPYGGSAFTTGGTGGTGGTGSTGTPTAGNGLNTGSGTTGGTTGGGVTLPAGVNAAISGGSTSLSGLGGTIGLTGGFGP